MSSPKKTQRIAKRPGRATHGSLRRHCSARLFNEMVTMMKVQEVLMRMPSRGMNGSPCHRKIRELIERATKVQNGPDQGRRASDSKQP